MAGEVNAIVVSLPVALIALIGVSLATKKPENLVVPDPDPDTDTENEKSPIASV